jgi:hypothetical protein
VKHTLDYIKSLVDDLAQKIAAPSFLIPSYGYSQIDAHPHIEVEKNGQLCYVIVERGKELRRDFAVDTDDLLYRIFAGITFSMAVKFEVNHRIAIEDSRRQMFAKQEELLGLLSESWKLREQKEHKYILRFHPYDDYQTNRADYAKELRDNGLSGTDAWSEACKKYPLPK